MTVLTSVPDVGEGPNDLEHVGAVPVLDILHRHTEVLLTLEVFFSTNTCSLAISRLMLDKHHEGDNVMIQRKYINLCFATPPLSSCYPPPWGLQCWTTSQGSLLMKI